MSKSARPAKAEISAMKHVLSVTERDEERTSETPIGESLRRLAKKGDMEAALVLEEMDSPGRRIDELLLEAAVEFDPYWEKLADGYYRHREGGAHKTPGTFGCSGPRPGGAGPAEARQKPGKELSIAISAPPS